MKLYDLGATVLVLALLGGAFVAANTYSPEFRQGVQVTKQKAKDAYDKYVEPYREEQPDWAKKAFGM